MRMKVPHRSGGKYLHADGADGRPLKAPKGADADEKKQEAEAAKASSGSSPRSVGAGGEATNLDEGERLFTAGDPMTSLAVLLDGALETRDDAGVAIAHAAGTVLGAWDVFGSDLREETVTATRACRILEIDRALFVDVLEDHADFAQNYLAKMSRRLLELRYGR